MRELDDSQFIEQLNRKSQKAFQQLYDQYYKMLVVYAMNFVSDQELAEDLVQELIVTLYEKDTVFINVISFKSYLYNAVRNSCLKHIRHQNVRSKHADFVKTEEEDFFDLELEMEEQEVYRRLFLLIESLPERCKQVFELHLQGHKNMEIAELLSISIETVKTQKKRALQRIKQEFGAVLLFGFFHLGM